MFKDRFSLSELVATATCLAVIMMFASCDKKNESEIKVEKETALTTAYITNITSSTVTVVGNITDIARLAYPEFGVCYATTANPTVFNTKMAISGTSTGYFSANLSGLSAETMYYVRAYATNDNGTVYGNEVSFTSSVKPAGEPDFLCATISDEANLCTEVLCTKYMKIWKELLIKRNELPEDYFCRHIELSTSGIEGWNDGTSFDICYSVKIDWAVAYNCDQFIININNNLYPALNVPRNAYLEKEDIEKVVNMQAFSSKILQLTSDEKLKFKSLEDAMGFAIEQTKLKNLTAMEVFIDKATGHISLEAAESNYEINKCIFVTLDLISGQINVRESVCVICNY